MGTFLSFFFFCRVSFVYFQTYSGNMARCFVCDNCNLILSGSAEVTCEL